MEVYDCPWRVLDVGVQHLPVLVREAVKSNKHNTSSNTLPLAVNQSSDEVALDGVDDALPGLHCDLQSCDDWSDC